MATPIVRDFGQEVPCATELLHLPDSDVWVLQQLGHDRQRLFRHGQGSKADVFSVEALSSHGSDKAMMHLRASAYKRSRHAPTNVHMHPHTGTGTVSLKSTKGGVSQAFLELTAAHSMRYCMMCSNGGSYVWQILGPCSSVFELIKFEGVHRQRLALFVITSSSSQAYDTRTGKRLKLAPGEVGRFYLAPGMSVEAGTSQQGMLALMSGLTVVGIQQARS